MGTMGTARENSEVDTVNREVDGVNREYGPHYATHKSAISSVMPYREGNQSVANLVAD